MERCSSRSTGSRLCSFTTGLNFPPHICTFEYRWLNGWHESNSKSCHITLQCLSRGGRTTRRTMRGMWSVISIRGGEKHKVARELGFRSQRLMHPLHLLQFLCIPTVISQILHPLLMYSLKHLNHLSHLFMSKKSQLEQVLCYVQSERPFLLVWITSYTLHSKDKLLGLDLVSSNGDSTGSILDLSSLCIRLL